MDRTRWARVVLGVASASMLVAGGAAVWVHQPANSVTVGDAVARFRAVTTTSQPPDAPADEVGTPTATAPSGAPSSPDKAGSVSGAAPSAASDTRRSRPPAAAPARLPEPGVYVYNTTGFEETDALGGVHRNYPARTTITVQHANCGWVTRWQPLEERYDEWHACAEGARRTVLRFTTYHEFFRRGQKEDFDCTVDGAAQWMPAERTAGLQWTWRCESGTSTVSTAATVVGVERIDVGGTAVDAVHLRYDATLSGSNEGSQVRDWWCEPDTGLVVKAIQKVAANGASPVGRVNYREEYTISLTSLKPQQ